MWYPSSHILLLLTIHTTILYSNIPTILPIQSYLSLLCSIAFKHPLLSSSSLILHPSHPSPAVLPIPSITSHPPYPTHHQPSSLSRRPSVVLPVTSTAVHALSPRSSCYRLGPKSHFRPSAKGPIEATTASISQLHNLEKRQISRPLRPGAVKPVDVPAANLRRTGPSRGGNDDATAR